MVIGYRPASHNLFSFLKKKLIIAPLDYILISFFIKFSFNKKRMEYLNIMILKKNHKNADELIIIVIISIAIIIPLKIFHSILLFFNI